MKMNPYNQVAKSKDRGMGTTLGHPGVWGTNFAW